MKENTKVILAGFIGNVMEWFDFAVYGYFAYIIGQHFFPSDDPSISLIAAFGAFAAGFLVRPLGGLFFGRIGDMVGREKAMQLSVMAMAIPTVMIGFMPTYESIGILAPIMIVLLRIVQGLSVGGEYTSSLVFLVERAKKTHRARMAFWGVGGATAGMLLGSAVGASISTLLSAEDLMAWGWRIPFLLGSLVGLTGYFIRKNIKVIAIKEKPKQPIKATFTTHKFDVLKVLLLNIGYGVPFYAAFVYAVTYIQHIDKLSSEVALNLNTLSLVLLLISLPFTAWLSDKYGRKIMLISGSAILTFGAIPFYMLMDHTNSLYIFFGELGFVMGIAIYTGGVVAANVELMPFAVRSTGLAFAYNASIGVFGGTTPLIAAYLIKTTGNPISPAYWVAATSLISLLTALFLIKESSKNSLES